MNSYQGVNSTPRASVDYSPHFPKTIATSGYITMSLALFVSLFLWPRIYFNILIMASLILSLRKSLCLFSI